MSKVNELISRCDDLTKNGDTLSVTWNGGNDSAWFEMNINGEPIANCYEDPILDIVADHLGYGSFAGDFSTEGEVVYDPLTQSFKGTDRYYTTESAQKNCSIEIRLPKDIWFDRLRLTLNIVDDYTMEITPVLQIVNGPQTDRHVQLAEELKEYLTGKIKEEIDQIKDFASIWQEWSVSYSDFKKEADEFIFTIQELEYSYADSTFTEIVIPLTSKICEHDII